MATWLPRCSATTPRRRSISARFCPYCPNSIDASLLSSNASTVWVVAVSSEAAADGITGSVVRKAGSGSCCCERYCTAFIGEAAKKAVAADFVDGHAVHRADAFGRCHDLHRLQIRRSAHELPGQSARLFEKHVDGASGKSGVEPALIARNGGLQPLQALGLHVRRNLLFHFGGGRPGARRVHEGECASVTNLVDQCEGVAEVRLGFTGEADDEIGCKGKVRAARTKTRNYIEIVLARMLAVHRRKN